LIHREHLLYFQLLQVPSHCRFTAVQNVADLGDVQFVVQQEEEKDFQAHTLPQELKDRWVLVQVLGLFFISDILIINLHDFHPIEYISRRQYRDSVHLIRIIFVINQTYHFPSTLTPYLSPFKGRSIIPFERAMQEAAEITEQRKMNEEKRARS
jgi:hypothetical protein